MMVCNMLWPCAYVSVLHNSSILLSMLLSHSQLVPSYCPRMTFMLSVSTKSNENITMLSTSVTFRVTSRQWASHCVRSILETIFSHDPSSPPFHLRPLTIILFIILYISTSTSSLLPLRLADTALRRSLAFRLAISRPITDVTGAWCIITSQ